jgi:hypothetical protein
MVVVRTLFIVTYPLNDLAGDTSTYLAMIARWRSSLVHAGGYPFLFGLVLSPFSAFPTTFSYLVLGLSHLIDLLATVVLFAVAAEIFGAAVAAAAALLYGLDVFGLSVTSAAYPEWLQGALLVVTLGAIYRAWRRPEMARRWYTVAGVLFALGVLVKFNTIFFAIVVLVPLLASAAGWRARLGHVAAAAGGGVAVVMAYLALFHYPSTGTTALTHDKAWVFSLKIRELLHDKPPRPEWGINTKRWLVFGGLLPQGSMGAGPGMFAHVDAVPAHVREPCRQRYNFVLSADEDTLNELLRRHPLPADYGLRFSWTPIARCLGLAEADDLAAKVLVEVVAANAGDYLRRVAEQTVATVGRFPARVQVPLTDRLNQYATTTVSGGFVVYDPAARLQVRTLYLSGSGRLWRPGIELFTAIDKLMPPRPLALALMVVAVGVATWRIGWRGDLSPDTVVSILLAVLILAFAVGANMALVFRWKEFRVLLPLVSLLFAVGAAELLRGVWARWRPARDKGRR